MSTSEVPPKTPVEELTSLPSPPIAGFCLNQLIQGRGHGLAVESTSQNPDGPGSIPRLGSRRSFLFSIEHVEELSNTPSFVLYGASRAI